MNKYIILCPVLIVHPCPCVHFGKLQIIIRLKCQEPVCYNFWRISKQHFPCVAAWGGVYTKFVTEKSLKAMKYVSDNKIFLFKKKNNVSLNKKVIVFYTIFKLITQIIYCVIYRCLCSHFILLCSQEYEHPKNPRFDIYAITSNFFNKFL